MTTPNARFKGFVFPGSNYVRHKRATVHLDNEKIRVVLEDDSAVFESSLDDLSGTGVTSFRGGPVPYLVMRGTSGFIRLGFSSMARRNTLLIIGVIVTFALAGRDEFGDPFIPVPYLHYFALPVAILFYLLAQRSVRSEEGPEFFERLTQLVPDIDSRTEPLRRSLRAERAGTVSSVPRPPWDRFAIGLLIFFAVLVGGFLLTILVDYAVWPRLPANERHPEGIAFRWIVLIASLVGLPLYYRYRSNIDREAGRYIETGQRDIDWPAMLAPVGLAGVFVAIIVFRRVVGI